MDNQRPQNEFLLLTIQTSNSIILPNSWKGGKRMKAMMNMRHIDSRLMAGSLSQTMSCTVRFLGVLCVYFWGFWAWCALIPV
jgi:hypothetical protein